jgi:hypothetical protein
MSSEIILLIESGLQGFDHHRLCYIPVIQHSYDHSELISASMSTKIHRILHNDSLIVDPLTRTHWQ